MRHLRVRTTEQGLRPEVPPILRIGSLGGAARAIKDAGRAFPTRVGHGDDAQPWDLAFPVEGDAAPASGAWGDYLCVRAIPGSSPQRFAATGWVLRGGDGDAAVEVHVLRFGAAGGK